MASRVLDCGNGQDFAGIAASQWLAGPSVRKIMLLCSS
jgi:hypothetical protein